MNLILAVFLVLLSGNYFAASNDDNGLCTMETRKQCEETETKSTEETDPISRQIQEALAAYQPCTDTAGDPQCQCHASVIEEDLKPYPKVTRQMLDKAAKYGTRYKILKNRLYRSTDCMFPTRCQGIEHFLLRLLPNLPDMDLVVNTRDWPQTPRHYDIGPVFSFSKTKDYTDIMYPAWTFWAGGPAISLHPTGIGRWDLMRERLRKEAERVKWSDKRAQGFFRGSRTSDERDSLVLLSRSQEDLVDAQYTKNQAWKSPKDTLNAEPAKEVSFEEHCGYKFLFNFRGVAASFRLKHLFLCKSLVFHVGDEWNEFFYFSLKPWVHYVPLKSYPSQKDVKDLLEYFREHDDLARGIAERGYDFIWQHLRMDDVECYWRKLLTAYADRLTYKVTTDPELIEIRKKNSEL